LLGFELARQHFVVDQKYNSKVIKNVIVYSAQELTSLAMYSPTAMLDVKPGLSIPNKLIKPGMP
jgi:hypothetical protein